MGRIQIATYIVQDLGTQLCIFAVQAQDKEPAFLVDQNIRQRLDDLGPVGGAGRIIP